MAGKNVDKTDKKIEKTKFQAGEQVLCYHGPLIYEAKCISIRSQETGTEYLIHYSGWNKSWDEWVAEDRLLKHSEENLAKKADLDSKNQKPAKKGGKRKSSTGPERDDNSRSNSPKPPIFGRKSLGTLITPYLVKVEKPQPDVSSSIVRKKKDPVVFPEPELHEHIEITIHLPEELQNLLIMDCELICKRKKLCKLPARVTVNDITDQYILHKTSVSDECPKFKETAIAMRNYFDLILPTKLLYAFEKPHLHKFLEGKSDVKPSSVCCVVHFIRMFAILGKLLAHLVVKEYGSSIVEEDVNDYLRYLNLNINKFISIDDYQNSTQDYQRKLRT